VKPHASPVLHALEFLLGQLGRPPPDDAARVRRPADPMVAADLGEIEWIVDLRRQSLNRVPPVGKLLLPNTDDAGRVHRDRPHQLTVLVAGVGFHRGEYLAVGSIGRPPAVAPSNRLLGTTICGRSRHGEPVRNRRTMPSNVRRWSFHGPPGARAPGRPETRDSTGSRTSHNSSEITSARTMSTNWITLAQRVGRLV